MAKYLHAQSPAGRFDTPQDVCGGGGAPVPQVVVEAAGNGSRLAPDQIIGQTTVNAMVVLPIFFFWFQPLKIIGHLPILLRGL